VQLKLRYSDFRTITRSRTFAEPTDLAADLIRTATELLRGVDLGSGIRLLGLSAQHLSPADAVQGALPLDEGAMTVIGSARDRWSRLERSVDEVRDRYGDDAVVPARLITGATRHAPDPPS
jgi:DNA polymerase-4